MSDDATATDTPTTAEAEEGHNWIEIIAATFLGLAAILTAYAAFNGALAASLARAPDAPFQSHVRFANRYAARSTERAGAAASMPRKEELEPLPPA